MPVTAVAHVPPQLMSQPVFNEYAFGGYLIFKGVKPYVDGRADMYGDAFVQEYLAIAGGAQPDVDKAFKRWNITLDDRLAARAAGARCWTPSPAGGGSTATATRWCSPRTPRAAGPPRRRRP